MTNGELAFMALAEELNFTRAAEKIYMSQQGLSDHIRRLEKEYDTVLVNRKPEVHLTPSGQELYNMLQQNRQWSRISTGGQVHQRIMLSCWSVKYVG